MDRQKLEEEYARLEESEGLFRERRMEIGKMLGKEEPPDSTKKPPNQDDPATLFDRMPAADLLELFYNDKPRWREIMEAKEQAGLRRLFGQDR